MLGFGSCSDHSRIGRALQMTFHLFWRNFCEILASHFAWQAQYSVMLEAQINHESLCVAGAVFGEVQVPLFMAGAAFGEIWNDSRSGKCCIFQSKTLVASAKSNLGCEAGCGLTVSFSDHGRIMVGSAPHCK